MILRVDLVDGLEEPTRDNVALELNLPELRIGEEGALDGVNVPDAEASAKSGRARG